MTETQFREEICRVGKSLFDRGYVHATAGNISVKLAAEQGCNPYPEGGFRMVCNTGAEGGQEVHHLHVHVMGGPRPWLRG